MQFAATFARRVVIVKRRRVRRFDVRGCSS
jgi:hypothetical protein